VVGGAWPRVWSLDGAGCAGACGVEAASARLGWSGAPVLLEIEGQLVDGDELVIRPLEVDVPVDSSILTVVELLADGLDSVTFESEEIVQATSCEADLNGDGILNVLDFVTMQQLFQAGDDAADVNGDGELSVLDFVAYQQLFVTGCA